MPQQVHQRNDPNLMSLASGGDLLRLFFRKTVFVRHLGAAGELETVINAQDQYVYRARREFLLDKLDELIDAVWRRRRDAKAPYGKCFVSGFFGCCDIDGQSEQEG